MSRDKSSPGLPDILNFITSIQKERREKMPRSQKRKRGRSAKYSDEVMAKISFVMLSKGIKEFKALWRYLKDNPKVRKGCGLKTLADRTTLMRRLKNFSPSI